MQELYHINKLYGFHPVMFSIDMRIGPSTHHKDGYLQGGDKMDVVVYITHLL
jgi:hypothetical protein